MAKVMISLPDQILKIAGITGVEISTEVNRMLILELYREGKISLGRAAEMAEAPLADFMNFMAGHNTYLNYGEADWQADEETLKRLM